MYLFVYVQVLCINCSNTFKPTFEFEFKFWCFTPLSAISWRPVLVVEEAGVPGDNHRPWASNW